eukprot:6937747-Pyramimonas_sp.AAC.1
MPQMWMKFALHALKVIDAAGAPPSVDKLSSGGAFKEKADITEMISQRVLYFRRAVYSLVQGPEQLTNRDFGFLVDIVYH